MKANIFNNLMSLMFISVLATTACTNKAYQELKGSQASENFIVGGTQVAEEDLISKSTVALYMKESPGSTRIQNYCSGTVIDTTHILTAGHCFADFAAEVGMTVEEIRDTSLVGFGTKVVKDSRTTALQFRKLAAVNIHEKYVIGLEDLKKAYFDVAIITLDSAIPEGALPAKLGSGDLIKKDMDITLAGFGLTNGFGVEAKQLMKVVVKVDDPALTETQFTYTDKKGSCGGDSGGPAYIIEPDNSLTVVGITSWGDQFCTKMGAYTSVPFMNEWITKILEADKPAELAPAIEPSEEDTVLLAHH